MPAQCLQSFAHQNFGKTKLTIIWHFQKLAKSEEEDVVGTYFKPIRASRLVAQAQETKRGKIFFINIFGLTQSAYIF